MKNFIFSMIAMFVMAISANAQNTTSHSKFFDNIGVGITETEQTNLHDWNAPQGAAVGIAIDKDITAIWGIGAEVGVGFNNNANWNCHKNLPDTRHQSLSCGGTAIENLYTFANLRFNLTNAICGYKYQPRVFDIEPTVGIGYGHAYGNAPEFYRTQSNDVILAKGGINFNANLGKMRQWKISLTPGVMYDLTHGKGKPKAANAVGYLSLGVKYYFRSSNGLRHFSNELIPTYVDVVKEKVVEKIVEKEVIKKVPVLINTEYIVNFDVNSTEILNKETLDNLKGTFDVIGYASPEGSASRNNELSEKRAQVVADYLRSKGCTVKSVMGMGSTGPAGRIVIVKRR